MSSRLTLTKVLTSFLILLMGFTVLPSGLATGPSLGDRSSPEANQVSLPISSGTIFPVKTVVLLPFEGNVLDSTPSHNNGIITGNAKYVTGKIGNYAFSFDGLTHVTLANASQFAFDKGNPFTISFWMKMHPNNSTDMYLISNANTPTSAGISIFKSHLSSGLTFQVQNQNKQAFQVSSSYNISDNAWHLVMCTFDGTGNQKGMRIYIDGGLQAVGTTSPISGTLVSNLSETVGSTVSGSFPYVGTLDNLQMQSYLLSSSDIQNFFGNPGLFSPILFPPIPTKAGVSLSWLPVIGAVGYNVYRDGIKITSTLEPSPSYYNLGLLPSSTHSYSIIAVNSTGGTSPPSNVTASTLATSLNTPLRIISFPVNITYSDIGILKSDMKSGDGITSARIPYIESLQDTLQISGMKHFPFSPRIGAIDPTCTMGDVPSMSQQVTQAQQANQSGYYIETVVYDIEGWCWTPLTEQQNYVSSIDKASQIVHAGGFKFGVVPTHAELLQWYPNIHWQNIDYLLIQAHKSVMTKESGYTLLDPKYISDVTNIINTARSQNPAIKIILTFNPNWEPVGSMIYVLNLFKNQVQGVDFYNVPPNNADNFGAPFLTWNTPSHQNQFLKALKAM